MSNDPMKDGLMDVLVRIGDGELPNALGPVRQEWYRLLENAGWMERPPISAGLANAIIQSMVELKGLARQAALRIQSTERRATADINGLRKISADLRTHWPSRTLVAFADRIDAALRVGGGKAGAATIIPEYRWPEWATHHCWDDDGTGAFYGMRTSAGGWHADCEDSKFPMPEGWDWRVPLMRHLPEPAVDNDWRLRGYAYASKQATTCAGCGEHKHTPLRIDAMGGHVCLTCIDQKLGTLLGEFGYPQPAPTIDLELVREAVDTAIALAGPNDGNLEGWRSLRARIDGQANVRSTSEHSSEVAGDNSVRVDRGALQMALNVLRRAGKCEVADALAGGVIDEQPTKGEGEKR